MRILKEITKLRHFFYIKVFLLNENTERLGD